MSSLRHWLVKSEPDTFSFDDLLRSPDRTTPWEGVRNYLARNFMRDEMKRGDAVLFYHSNTSQPGVVGVAEVVGDAYPDPTQFDPASPYFDEKASEEEPRWFLVDIRAVHPLPHSVSLQTIKEEPELSGMKLVRRGNRLSVMPVSRSEFARILMIGGWDD